MIQRALLVVVVAAQVAWATDEYPAVIQTKYSLGAPPAESCALCHTNFQTARGTVNTPVGAALRQRGLVAFDSASLRTALDRLASEGVDSDGDGRADVDELIAGTSPNVADESVGGGDGGQLVLPPPIGYGCGAFAVDGAPLVLLALMWLGRAKRS